MPDLLAGSTVKGLDTPPTVEDSETAAFTFTNTTFGVGTTGGTYADCGVAFVAPTTGRVMIDYVSRLDNDTVGGYAMLCPVVRTGSTVGSGTVVFSASDDDAIYKASEVVPSSDVRLGAAILVSGLTPGSSYNVRLEHRVNTGSGSISRRRVIVAPAT